MTAAAIPTDGPVRVAHRVDVHGTVQGVGFRPFVYRLAKDLGLDGSVRNAGGHVVVEVAGPPAALGAFATRLRAEAPPRARVTRVHVAGLDPQPAPGSGFRVVESTRSEGAARDIPPDIATCADCVAELFDPADRRYRYPFVNCTNCGPRATIIDDLPYDRRRTAMAGFELCRACAAEYADPADRRFHAEPVACPDCGPRLSWWENGRAAVWHGEDALRSAVDLIRLGGIAAVKGLGGYQLVCDATRTGTVARLRRGKHRPTKPFALMVPGLAAASAVAHLTAAETRLLTSPARPIVLVRARRGEPAMAGSVHPGTDRIGLFLPTTGLHHLLLHDLGRPLVVTSGNRAGEPIAIDDAGAQAGLAPIVDGFLRHDRPIRSRYDDSVTRVVAGGESVLRRARGYAPEPLPLPVPADRPLLAVGAQLKHTFTLALGHRAVVSPHTGDLEDVETLEAFAANLRHLRAIQGITPEVVAHDLHPGYLSTQFAARWPADRRIAVQHHHAHVASCAAEHGISGPFLGVAYDGLGLGDDGTLWGGEILLATLTGYRRMGRFGTAPMPGGAAAVRRPIRMALGYLFGAERFDDGDQPSPELVAAATSRLDAHEVRTVRRMIDRGVNSPRASSAGRLFDAVASLLGLTDDASYEGEAAVLLEAAAGQVHAPAELPWRIVRSGQMWVYDPVPTLDSVLLAVAEGTPVGRVAAAFHDTLTAVTLDLCGRAAREVGLRDVCLSGGCFQNRRLARGVAHELRREGFGVFINSRVPVNDGGISYGQAAIAAARR